MTWASVKRIHGPEPGIIVCVSNLNAFSSFISQTSASIWCCWHILPWYSTWYINFKDMYGTSNSAPSEDSSNDVELISGSETDRRTSVTFKRKINTCDADHDRVLVRYEARQCKRVPSHRPIYPWTLVILKPGSHTCGSMQSSYWKKSLLYPMIAKRRS